MLWSFGLIVTCVSFLNLYSTRLTSAMYVMLLRLATPYIVVVLNRVLLHEQLPSHFLAYLMVESFEFEDLQLSKEEPLL